MTKPYQLRWGILATGGIAQTFGKDILLDPKTRGIEEIEHVVVAAAASSSQTRAREFLDKIGAGSTSVAYGSYKELVDDSNVDIIYIATPHSHHYQHCMLCLEAGKNVLCEKAFTANAEQLALLIEKAREKNVFLMEAAWTRYFPVSLYVRDHITSGTIGTVYRTFADLSNIAPPENFPSTHRLVSPDLAGGALLDIGIYALTWVFQTLYTTQLCHDPLPPRVQSTMRKNSHGTDEQTTMLLTFPRDEEGDAHGIAMASVRIHTDPAETNGSVPAVRIQGSRGEIQVFHPAFRPVKTRLIFVDGAIEEKLWPQPGPGKGSGWYNGFENENGGGAHAEGEGHGMFWEADECAYALRDGRKESQHQNLRESLVIMQTMDQIRRDGYMQFSPKVETTDYPVEF